MKSRHADAAAAAPSPVYDLGATIENLYRPPEALALQVPFRATSNGFDPLSNDLASYSTSIKLPSASSVRSCSVVPDDAQSSESGRNPRCQIDNEAGTAKVSVDLEKPGFFTSAKSFKATVNVMFSPLPSGHP